MHAFESNDPLIATFGPDRLNQLGDRDLSDALERGQIVFFPECPLPLPDESALKLLREELPSALKRKNVTLYVRPDRLVGIDGDRDLEQRVHRALQTHAQHVREFLYRAMGPFMQGVEPGSCSFRPMEEQGRKLSRHASNELIHVDAGAYGATHGGRIMRFFVNVHPSRTRVWTTKGNFPELYKRLGRDAGVADESGRCAVDEGPLDRVFSGLIGAAMRSGFPMARVIDSSPYDRAMRRFHNFMKDSDAFQTSTEGHRQFEFPAFSAWMVLTDMVSHACISGQYAFTDTFVVPLANCRLTELAPFHVLKSGGAPEQSYAPSSGR